MFEAVLVSLADHGFTPTAIAARLTYTSAPESIQGALAAGLLGGGSRFLGVTEDAARFLADGLAEQASLPEDEPDGTSWRPASSSGRGRRGASCPVSAIPCTGSRTPARRCCSSSPGGRARSGRTCELFAAIGRVHPPVLGQDAAAERCRHVRRGAGRPRPAGRRHARLRPPRPLRRPPRAPRRGGGRPDRHGDLPERRPEHRLPTARAPSNRVGVSARWYSDRWSDITPDTWG